MGLLMRGFAGFQVLIAGVRLGLFELLHRQPERSLEEIRAHLDLPDHSARALLLACASLRLVERAGAGTYRNSAPVEDMLVGAAGARIGAHLEAFDVLMYRPFHYLTETLRRGTNVGLQVFPGAGDTLYERLESDPEGKRTFHEWMGALSAAAERIPAAVIAAFRGSRHVLDVGGGTAGNAIELARRLPEIEVGIVDLPGVCEIAARNAAAAGLADRIAVHPTPDFHRDPFPRGADAILFAHIFNIYSDDANQALVQRAADALPRGGRLAVYNLVSADDQTGPWHAGFMSLYFQVVATGSGFVYPASRYEAWFAKAGFAELTIGTAESGDTYFVGIK